MFRYFFSFTLDTVSVYGKEACTERGGRVRETCPFCYIWLNLPLWTEYNASLFSVEKSRFIWEWSVMDLDQVYD